MTTKRISKRPQGKTPAMQSAASAPHSILDVEVCERARLSRDRRFDGSFFIGVATTGIYCRPICPVQPPKPKNVSFYPSAAAAEDAGLRPCLRCRPECSPGSPAWAGTSSTVNRALRLIDEGALDDEGVDGLARRLGVGERHLRRLFKAHLGTSPSSVARTRRLLLAKQLIDESDLPMSGVAMASGYGSVRRFNEAVRKNWGRTPSALRNRRSSKRQSRLEKQTSESSVNDTTLIQPEPPIELRLSYVEPYNFDCLLRFLTPRAIPGVAVVQECTYFRTFDVNDTCGWFSVVRDEAHKSLVAKLYLQKTGSLLPLAERLRRLFDLYARPAEIEAALGQDPTLLTRIKAQPGLRVAGAWDGFEIGVRAILGQQVTVKGATTLASRFVTRWGRALNGIALPPGLTHVFPVPERIARLTQAVLAEGIGVPKARATALIELASAIVDGRVDLTGAVSPEVLVKQLVALRGIGEWTAQYVAMRALGDPDAFPAGDLGLRKALADELPQDGGLPDERRMLERAESWRPWRSYAAMLLWQG